MRGITIPYNDMKCQMRLMGGRLARLQNSASWPVKTTFIQFPSVMSSLT